jgi:hypothetical protein
MAFLLPVVKLAAKSLISMLMSLATEAFFKEIFLMLAEMAAKSTKTPYDDKLVESMKKALSAEEK